MSDTRQSGYRLDQAESEDVVQGPAVATDDAIVLFEGTTGKVVKDSGVTIAALQAASVTPKKLRARIVLGV